MAYESGTSDEAIQVFVSYSRADTEFALDLVAGLQACGFEAFIDQEDIAPGEPWEQRPPYRCSSTTLSSNHRPSS